MIDLDRDRVLVLLDLKTLTNADRAKSSLNICLPRSIGVLCPALIESLVDRCLVLISVLFLAFAHSLRLLLDTILSLLLSVKQQTMDYVIDYC